MRGRTQILVARKLGAGGAQHAGAVWVRQRRAVCLAIVVALAALDAHVRARLRQRVGVLRRVVRVPRGVLVHDLHIAAQSGARDVAQC